MKCAADTRGLALAGLAATTSSAGGAIRTLSVSLLAAVAIAASLLIVRKVERPVPGLAPAGEHLPAERSLDAIREAGL